MLRELKKHIEVFGTTGWLYALIARLAKLVHFEHRVRVTVPGYAGRRLEVRLGTSDLEVFREVFYRREFEIGPLETPRYIIDAGANAGFSTAYFALEYPDARILAVELEPSNFRQLIRNAKGLTNVVPIQAGLWGSPGRLRIVDSGKGKWAYSAAPADAIDDGSDDRTVQSVTVSQLMEQLGAERIGILKLDIEGGEREVLRDSALWIDRVDCLIVELHDRLVEGCTTAFEHALRNLEVDRERRGEKVIVHNRTHTRPAD